MDENYRYIIELSDGMYLIRNVFPPHQKHKALAVFTSEEKAQDYRDAHYEWQKWFFENQRKKVELSLLQPGKVVSLTEQRFRDVLNKYQLYRVAEHFWEDLTKVGHDLGSEADRKDITHILTYLQSDEKSASDQNDTPI